MKLKFPGNLSVFGVCLVCAALVVSGCTGSSTYGTGVSQEAQLVNDLTGIFGGQKKPRIDYRDRPEIVKPQSVAVLPAPEDNTAVANANWPESPEQRLLRLREELKSEDPATRAEAKRVLLQVDQAKRDAFDERQQKRLAQLGINKETAQMTPEERRAFIEAYRKNNPNDITQANRRYLSEPPSEYRSPAQTAGFGDLGLSEDQKRECLKQKGSRNLFRRLGSAGKKDICKEYLASLNLVEPEKKN